VSPQAVLRAAKWTSALRLIVNIARILALVSVAFMFFIALLMTMVLVAGQLPGAGMAVAAFFWAVGLIVLILPWSALLPDVAGLPVGVPTLGELHRSLGPILTGGDASVFDHILAWVRFVVYPVIIALITVMYVGRLGQANLQITGSQPTISKESPV